MSNIQNLILIVTALVSIIGLCLGLMNFFLNVKNRRNSIREKIFSKQLDLFLELNGLLGAIMDNSHFLWHPKIRNKEDVVDELDNLTDQLDEKITHNEIIIPDELNSNFTVLLNYLNNSLREYYEDDLSFTEEKKTLITATIIDIYIDIEDYMSIDNLSKENMRIARGKRIESRLDLEKVRQNKVAS